MGLSSLDAVGAAQFVDDPVEPFDFSMKTGGGGCIATWKERCSAGFDFFLLITIIIIPFLLTTVIITFIFCYRHYYY